MDERAAAAAWEILSPPSLCEEGTAPTYLQKPTNSHPHTHKLSTSQFWTKFRNFRKNNGSYCTLCKVLVLINYFIRNGKSIEEDNTFETPIHDIFYHNTETLTALKWERVKQVDRSFRIKLFDIVTLILFLIMHWVYKLSNLRVWKGCKTKPLFVRNLLTA